MAVSYDSYIKKNQKTINNNLEKYYASKRTSKDSKKILTKKTNKVNEEEQTLRNALTSRGILPVDESRYSSLPTAIRGQQIGAMLRTGATPLTGYNRNAKQIEEENNKRLQEFSNSQEYSRLTQNIRNAKNEEAIARAEYDQKLAQEDYENLSPVGKFFNNTIGAGARGMFSTVVKSDSIVRNEDGSYYHLPSYAEALQEETNRNSKGLSKVANEMFFQMGRRATSQALNTIVPGAGTITYYGDMYTDQVSNAIRQGYNKEQALSYATLGTISEIVTDKVLGSTVGLFSKSGTTETAISEALKKIVPNVQINKILSSMGAEALEEFVQEYIDIFNRNLTLGEDNKLFTMENFKNALYSALIGGLSAGGNVAISNLSTDTITKQSEQIVYDIERANNGTLSNTNKALVQNIIYEQMFEGKPNIDAQSVVNQFQQIKSEKIKAFEDSALANFKNTQETQAMMDTVKKVIYDKNYNVVFDNTMKDGISGSIQGNTIKLNPDSPYAGEFVLMHEITHSIGSENLKKMILKHAKNNSEFNNKVESLKKTYGTEDVTDEIMCDISAQYLGNQEFINSIKTTDKNGFQKLYDGIISVANNLTGGKNENLFMKNLANEWTNAYNETIVSETTGNEEIKYAKNTGKGTIYSLENGTYVDYNNANQKIPDAIIPYVTTDEAKANYLKYTTNEDFYKLSSDDMAYVITQLNGVVAERVAKGEYKGTKNVGGFHFDYRVYDNGVDFEITKVYEIKEIAKEVTDEGFNETNSSAIEESSKYGQGQRRGDINEVRNGRTSNETSELVEDHNIRENADISSNRQSGRTNEELDNSSFFVDNKGRQLTKEQQEYFKDSKVRDENGNLKVVYHGTPFGNFTTFKGHIFFFSEDYKFAEDYAYSKSFEQGLDGDIKVVEAYLKAENVFDVTDQTDIQKLREALPDEVRYWSNTWDKETLLKRLQRKTTLEPKWKPEQIVGKKFGDYIGDDRSGYNTDMFVGVNEQNEIVYISQERGLQRLTDTEKVELEKKLMSGEEASYTTYETIYGELTERQIQEKINELKEYGENYKKETGFDNETVEESINRLNSVLKWELGKTNHKLTPKVTTQETTELDDIDNWTYFETAFDPETSKDIIDIIRDLGYDAINIYENGKSNYIVFNPNQIKSVTNENPTDDPDIRYAKDNDEWHDYLNERFGERGTRTDLGKISKKIQEGKTLNPNEISKLTPEDANTTPMLPSVMRNKVGDGDSKFAKNIRNKTKMLSEEHRELLANEEDIAYYDKITNEESLEEAYTRLENGSFETEKWFNKPSENATAVDVAEGWILLKQYADNNDTNGMVEVAKKMREIGTKAGQTVQAYNIMARLTPEGMVKYAQSELMEAYDKMVKNQTKKWIDENRDKFDLKPNEVQFIMDTMKDVSTMEDGYEKRVKLAEIQKLMTDKLPPSKGAGIKSWMRISMLFNPKTQVRNVAGNTVIAPVNYFGDLFASGVDKLISQKTGVRTTGTTKIGKYTEGFKKGLFQSYNDFKKGINTRNIEGNRFEIGEGKSFNNKTVIGKGLNKVDSLLSFMLDAGDRGFYEASFTNSINNQMVLNNTNEVTQEMIDIATQEALSRTWQDNNNYTKFVLDIRKGLNQFKMPFVQYGLGDVLIPFAKTPANLTKAIVDYSPAGFITAITDGRNLKNSLENGQFTPQMQHKFVQDLGKATAGTMLYVLGYALATAGITSGESDDDKDVANFLKNVLGVSSYSIKIGNKTFTYDWAQPVASPFAITSNIVNAKDNKEIALLEAITGSLDSAGSTLLEQSFLQSISDVLNSNDGVVSGLITEALELPARAIPTLSKQITDMIDGTQRQTYVKDQPIESAFNYAKSKLPGFSKKLAPQVDTLGREIQKYGGKNNLFNVMLNPANVNTENISEAGQEIYDVYTATGDKTVMPRVVDYTYKNALGQTIPLTTHQRAKLQKETGQMVEKNVLDLMDNEIYQELSDVDKASMLNNIVNFSYNIAKHEVLNTEVPQTYSTAYAYSKIGNISDYFLVKLPNFESDKDAKGNSISGSKKLKVINYINSMPNLNKTEKAILVKINDYSLKDTEYQNYDKLIVNYVLNKDLTDEEYETIFNKLDFSYKNGKVYSK